MRLIASHSTFGISDVDMKRLIGRLQKDHNYGEALAERVILATLAFLAMCAKHRDKVFSPSAIVDDGWHTLLMYTRIYANIFKHTGVQFVHHQPFDVPGEARGACPKDTVRFMVDSGIDHDETVWIKYKPSSGEINELSLLDQPAISAMECGTTDCCGDHD